ncbi:Spore coat protein U (SCPU) domain-containing protein [Pseudomonas asplenii]|uniref:Spore coat protein U (SCPU) domain-containing protein n=1 Tax=Pseudomonas asplenii TaxID=53407 RepID=A0A1H1WNV4_9PSED|nr:spore coat U domain-containing protein [Pseudomonas asplenii]SDS98311.1 Spore coat protein U (SCPU) domain-containing protein [Pseudomonas asplenii]
MKHRNRAVLAFGSLLFLADRAAAVMTGTIDVQMVISPACEVSSAGAAMSGSLGQLHFGNQGPTWTGPINANIQNSGSTVHVTCNASVNGFTVTIDGGVNGDGSTRRLSNGNRSIAYRLTVDAEGKDSYGVGEQRNFAVSSDIRNPIPVFGVVVANTNALPAGVYRDTLTVTLDW